MCHVMQFAHAPTNLCFRLLLKVFRNKQSADGHAEVIVRERHADLPSRHLRICAVKHLPPAKIEPIILF